jgi:glycosyltransferase involved in cell wall biosynthesis
MRICVYLHLFPPEHNAGSETTVHAAMRAMVQRGHQVDVICDRSRTAPYDIDGIKVHRPPRRGTQRWLQEFVADCDLLITHLDLTSLAMQLALAVRKPLVHFIHNDAQLEFWRVNTAKAQLVVFNSHWIAESEKRWYWLRPNEQPCTWPGPSVTVHPVVEPQHYICERGDSITLVNPTSGKGAATFYELAHRMPDKQFVTAQGGYGHQVACPSRYGSTHHVFYDETGSEQNCYGLPNVTHLRNDPDVRNVFRQTKVLLMPSDYESYGRVGVEAACAGIPTIAHPTPGLKEAFGDAAIFLHRDDVDSWQNELERLFNDNIYYKQRSDAALALAASLQPEAEFDRLEAALIKTADDWKQQHEAGAMNIWVSDRIIWKTKSGGYKVEVEGRIPQDAVTLFAGVGTKVSRDLAVEQGWIGDQSTIMQVKAVEEPEENKMVAGPAENKAKRVKAA